MVRDRGSRRPGSWLHCDLEDAQISGTFQHLSVLSKDRLSADFMLVGGTPNTCSPGRDSPQLYIDIRFAHSLRTSHLPFVQVERDY
jgi:hypothetical protein